MSLTTERNKNIVSGAIGLLVLISLVTVGIKASFGAFDGGYELRGTFAAAGQGLLVGSDVKVRGVNVGEVAGIDLVDNRALLTLRIRDRTDVPETVQAVIRPKTLFGEKFVDLLPGDDELTGPYLGDGDEIVDTLGGFELEQVLSDTYPVLLAVDPAELAVILDELATAGAGLGENVNRTLVNASTVTDLAVSNDPEFRQFTSDLALLSEELDQLAPDLIRGARNLNAVLPTINERSDRLNVALTQAGRLAGDLSDLLESNKSFTDNALTNGSRVLQTVFDRRGQLQPLLLGIQQYAQTLAESIRIEVGDGTMMAAVKNLVSVQELVGGLAIPDTGVDEIDSLVDGLTEPLPDVSGLGDQLGPVADEVITGALDPLLSLLSGGGR